MATKSLRVKEQHIAVFGESGSGKTVLVSSFFGPTQEGTYSNDLWDLVADDTGQGNRLYKNYVGMRESATLPPPTRFNATTYRFSLKLKVGDQASATKRPFDVLRLVWHDYPGEWFEETPSSEEEANRRVDTFQNLLGSDVALLLVDAQKLIDNKDEEERYLKSLFANFRQGLLRLREDLLEDQGPLVAFPRIWILALSKSDLLPDWNVDKFRDLVIWKAAEQIEMLRETLQGLIAAPEALAIGEDFMLLSSAKFQLSPDKTDPVAIDVTKRVGVDLLLPVASILPLERRVQWGDRMKIPQDVLENLADGADSLAFVLTTGSVPFLIKFADKVPKAGTILKVAIPALAAAAKLVGDDLRDLNRKARENHDFMQATLSQFKIDLEEGVKNKLLFRSLK